jgi:hypothetical protein
MVRVDVEADRIDPTLAAYREALRPVHERARGLRTHLVLADRDGGSMAFIGVWESAASIDEIAGELETARERLWSSFGGVPAIDRFEVIDLLTHEEPPGTA